jgi:hypothetical protein
MPSGDPVLAIQTALATNLGDRLAILAKMTARPPGVAQAAARTGEDNLQ